ncbi:hypothetical protein E4U57_006564 [Claviceps arundinis]|uniref:Hikeshi-like domain-containing protein n=1 Tax=Claviceps arundinis TaxID=1623583 RepID=A0A9P7MN75_9HYPO|nr:hypothetical protein E4U57_006564 [Claviceps arundinis]KAG5962676.1 hypothetical protein E4U56_003244 [Claviceps arundinis]
MSERLFGVVPAGQQLITEPTSTPSPTSFLYTLPTAVSFSHIMVFILPNISVPEGNAAAIYIGSVRDVAHAIETGGTPNFKFLGGVGSGKHSALFKITPNSTDADGNGLVLGISIESSESVKQKLQDLAAEKTNALAVDAHEARLSTTILAQRIIQNAFNFLASFSGSAGPGGVEVVPLKAFEEWWRKFEARVRADPDFLDRQRD